MRLIVALLIALLLVGCGGGGGGPQTFNVVGRVLNVETGGPTNPRSSVQIGSGSVLTSASDGSFTIGAPPGTAALTVDTLTAALGVWVFTFAPVTGITDVGDLWVGPERVTVQGVVRDASTNEGIAGAVVRFAGRSATTDATGQFALTEVAYSSATQVAFWGIAGFASKSGYIGTQWSAQPHLAVGGVVMVDDIFLTPNSDPNPPPTPFNIWGRVSPAANAPGTVATLKLNGNPVRVFNVGGDGIYRFWIGPGTYSIDFVNGALTANVPSVIVNAPNHVQRIDVTLQ